MIFGMTTAAFTLAHVIISLVGIAAGVVAVTEMLAGKPLGHWNAIFLATTIATSVTGFFFHSAQFGPPHVIGIISLAVLAVALFALYGRHLQGYWRPTYAVSAVLALYLNAFVGVVQAFQKIGPLKGLAPTQSEPPFLVAQATVLGLFLIVGYQSFKRLRTA